MLRQRRVHDEVVFDLRAVAIFHDGAWAGLGAAVVGLLVYWAGGAFDLLGEPQKVTRGLFYVAVGLGLGPPFAWLTSRVRTPLVVAGTLYALAFGLGAGARSADEIAALLVYGAMLGLIVRNFRTRRLADAP